MRVAVGFRIKTAKTILVALAPEQGGPRVVRRETIALSDPAVPDSHQPYHAGLGLRGPAASKRIEPACAAVRAVARENLAALFRSFGDEGLEVDAAGLVVNSMNDPARLGNEHVRAHASEGRLFRDAVDDALADLGRSTHTFLERDLVDELAARLGSAPATWKKRLGELGKPLGPPWRADEKAAAAAAWLGLPDA